MMEEAFLIGGGRIHRLVGQRGAGKVILKALGFEPTPYYRKAES